MHPTPSPIAVAALLGIVPVLRTDGALPPGLSDAATELHQHALDLSREAPREIAVELPEAYANLHYDRYRSIRARPERRLWAGPESFFSAEPLHLGAQYRVPVSLTAWSYRGGSGGYDLIPYEAGLFEFPDGLEPLEGDAGFGGVRFFSRESSAEEPAEFLVFHGASYFRAVGRDHGFGTSARAVALGTAEPEGEEFPAITTVLVESPEPGDRELRVHALLESPSLTGVLSMAASPGVEAAMDVEVTLYPRVDLTSVGIAPLTSMFYFDRSRGQSGVDDFRGAVHDADGLKVITGSGERLWRPLTNPDALQVSAFLDESPRGFGLVQRARGFQDYGDAEARYERRPSVWIEPLPDEDGNGWGAGAVHLVEIPTETEFNDNVVAFWRPAEALKAGTPHRFAYRMLWCDEAPDRAPLLRVAASRSGRAPNDGRRLLVVDYAAEAERAPGLEGAAIEASASAGEITDTDWSALPDGKTWRATVSYRPDPEVDVAELSVRVVADGKALAERWMHRWIR